PHHSTYQRSSDLDDLRSFPTRRSSDLSAVKVLQQHADHRHVEAQQYPLAAVTDHVSEVGPDLEPAEEQFHLPALAVEDADHPGRSEEHTSELQSRENIVCRLLLEKKKL